MADSSSTPYPGQRLGLPEQGPGSMAAYLPRLGGFTIDWLIAYGLAWWLFDLNPLAIMGFFVATTAPVITLLGGTLGHLLLGMRLNTVDGQAPGWWRPWLRQALLVLVLPALITDQDHRGAHDVLAGLVLRTYARER